MIRHSKALAAATVALAASIALGHGPGGVHLKGTIKAVGETTITIDTTDHKVVDATLDGRTRFERGAGNTTRQDLAAGERVVVHAEQTRGGGLRAELVKVGARKAPQAQDGGTHGQR